VILGEICNFCAYAFVEAILVTPLGALVRSLVHFRKFLLTGVLKVCCDYCDFIINIPQGTTIVYWKNRLFHVHYWFNCYRH
jgi:hypothetical protein